MVAPTTYEKLRTCTDRVVAKSDDPELIEGLEVSSLVVQSMFATREQRGHASKACVLIALLVDSLHKLKEMRDS